MTRLRHACLLTAFVAAFAVPVLAQSLPPELPEKEAKRVDVFERTPPFEEQVRDLRHALTRLPIAAGLVRYRAKIDDPKDAGVMLSTLAVGLAAGVGVWLLASFATVFILGLLWVVESMEPLATDLFTLTVKAKDPAEMKARLDALLTRYHLPFELRATSKEELVYEVRTPAGGKTDRLSDRILKLDPKNVTEVAWEDKKEKK